VPIVRRLIHLLQTELNAGGSSVEEAICTDLRASV